MIHKSWTFFQNTIHRSEFSFGMSFMLLETFPNNRLLSMSCRCTTNCLFRELNAISNILICLDDLKLYIIPWDANTIHSYNLHSRKHPLYLKPWAMWLCRNILFIFFSMTIRMQIYVSSMVSFNIEKTKCLKFKIYF
jgi:hypothetical protein